MLSCTSFGASSLSSSTLLSPPVMIYAASSPPASLRSTLPAPVSTGTSTTTSSTSTDVVSLSSDASSSVAASPDNDTAAAPDASIVPVDSSPTPTTTTTKTVRFQECATLYRYNTATTTTNNNNTTTGSRTGILYNNSNSNNCSWYTKNELRSMKADVWLTIQWLVLNQKPEGGNTPTHSHGRSQSCSSLYCSSRSVSHGVHALILLKTIVYIGPKFCDQKILW